MNDVLRPRRSTGAGAPLSYFDGLMEVDRNGMEVLDREECLALLAQVPVARIGITIDALPVILPVNFVVAGDAIVVRSAEGTKLTAALNAAVVALEADQYDPVSHAGWSVLVCGSSRVLTDPAEITPASRLPLRAWANDGADRFISIGTDLVSGRRTAATPLR